MKPDFKKLKNRMDRWYSVYYDNADSPIVRDDVSEWSLMFDTMMETDFDFAELTRKFVEYRGDAITSDREAAAYMKAYDNVTNGVVC